jgi:hypothetical protein
MRVDANSLERMVTIRTSEEEKIALGFRPVPMFRG